MRELKSYENAKKFCHVRSSIFRVNTPEIRYPKNHPVPFDERVPLADQAADDWMEYDPRDSESPSAAMA